MKLGERGEAYFLKAEEYIKTRQRPSCCAKSFKETTNFRKVLSADNISEPLNNHFNSYSDNDLIYRQGCGQSDVENIITFSVDSRERDDMEWTWGEVPGSKTTYKIKKNFKKNLENIVKTKLVYYRKIKNSFNDSPVRLFLYNERSNFDEYTFSQYEISLIDYLKNPFMYLKNPNLTVKIEDKLYNWADASSHLLAVMMLGKNEHFNRKLERWDKYHRVLQDHHHPNCKKYKRTKNKKHVPVENSDTNDLIWNEWTHRYELYCACLSDSEEDGKKINLSNCSEDNILNENDQSNLNETSEMKQKSIRLSSHELKKLNLKKGRNEIIYSVTTQYQGTTEKKANIFLWEYTDKLVISDIDGTITRSDILGNIFNMVGKDWTHKGIANFYQKIVDNGYKLVYLSSRCLGQSDLTRVLIQNVKQDSINMPPGPILISPSSLMKAINTEMIRKVPEKFKSQCLRDVASLFYKKGRNESPLYAGFGNKMSDYIAYNASGICVERIFIVNYTGTLKRCDTPLFSSSYITMANDLLNHIFPSINHTTDSDDENLEDYNSYNYWKSSHINIDTFMLSKLNCS
ncbi:hypothetical protein A3Q56_04510 [Intoshia linei]|uniref:LNS2/PITP domain-containing protein n=1 Tax=Intoshia linei TaxID=1819745 RepID=A0A177B2A8_9BILA|nr:hypothetical protein A3Q56_04510 [Intoshia linei]